MKKLAFVIYLLVSCLISVSSQSSYVYKTTFYFENALGARDTIVMTVDSLYIPMDTFPYYYEYHPELFVGDTVFAVNPDKKFEVFTLPNAEHLRSGVITMNELVYGLYPGSYHYFRDVTVDYYASPVNQYVDLVFFLFKCKRSAMPITVTWDHTYYEGLNGYNVAKWGQFMPEPTHITIPDAVPDIDFYVNPDKVKCLLYDGTWTFHLGDDSDYSLPFAKLFGFIEGTSDTLYGLTLYNSGYANCSTISTHQVEEQAVLQLNPNPATSQVALQVEGAVWETLEVLDVAGRRVSAPIRQSDNQSATLDTARLPAGIYSIRLQRSDHGFVVKRFVKQ